MAVRTQMPLGELLILNEVITQPQLDEALRHKQTVKGKKLGQILIDLGFTQEIDIKKALEYQYRYPLIDLSNTAVDKDAVSTITEQLARQYLVIPYERDANTLTVAMNDPLDLDAIDDIRRATAPLEIRAAIALKDDIISAIDRYYGTESASRAVESLKDDYISLDADELSKISESEVANAPVVKLIDSILSNAIKTGASDIHIEPMEKDVRVRFRTDGSLHEVMRLPKNALSATVTRIKIISSLDIAERRIPQDGRVEMLIDERRVDLRISILPTVYGEKTVIRVLGRGKTVTYNRAAIGFTPKNMELFDTIIKSSNGIILVSGPTGSGKSTTLYTVLSEKNTIDTNVITVEDPVENKLDGINQVQVNVKAGLTFSSGLRSILRQDPDIIMIGEIRDGETAEIAMRAAITGHLVFSTIHTNDAPSSISRLVDMGVQPYLVATSVVGIIAQRLVRKVCNRCKLDYEPDPTEIKLFQDNDEEPPTALFKGEGCPQCHNTGYFGRTAIHEVLPIGREIKELIEKNATVDELRQAGVRNGTRSLMQSCLGLVRDGVTSMAELNKVTYTLE